MKLHFYSKETHQLAKHDHPDGHAHVRQIMKSNNNCPDSWEQDLSCLAQAKFYLVSRRGPTLFKLKSGDTESTYNVCIASPSHRCSCGGGQARSSCCIHILFVVIKILKVNEPLAWQLSWSESDLERVLSGRLDRKDPGQRHAFLRKGDGVKSRKGDESVKENGDQPTAEASVAQRELEQSSTCSICQDEMTASELDDNLLCYCESSCGSSFHKACMRIFVAHARIEKKPVSCPLCRGQWTAPLAPEAKSKITSSKMLLPTLKCNNCRLTVRKQFVRCASCPTPLDLCMSCYEGGALSSHDPRHCFFVGDVSQYPTQWTAAARPSIRRDDKERLSLLQYRDIGPGDYHDLLSLTSGAPPLHEHLTNALPDILTSDCPDKCLYCKISLRVDRTAKQFPCNHIVHRTCAVSIFLSALSTSDCEGGAVGSILCPFCPDSTSDAANSALMFPSLQREPRQDKAAKKTDASKKVDESRPPSDVTNLSKRPLALGGDAEAITLCQLSITGVTQSKDRHGANREKVGTSKQACHCKRDLLIRKSAVAAAPLDLQMIISGNSAKEKARQRKQKTKQATKRLERSSSKLAPRCISGNGSRIKDRVADDEPASKMCGMLQVVGGRKIVK